MIDQNRLARAAAPFAVLALLASPPLRGEVNLEWRFASLPPCASQIYDIELYAVSTAGDKLVSAMDVVLTWDAADMTLVGVINNGPYSWLYAGLPPNDLDGLNLTFADGDAIFTALSQLVGGSAVATPGGLRVTTFRFQRAAPPGHTRLRIAATYGAFSNTAVYDGLVPNLNIVGTMGSSLLGGEVCDTNCDGSVNQFDIEGFIQVLLTHAGCSTCAGDANGDGTVNQFDINDFVECLLP